MEEYYDTTFDNLQTIPKAEFEACTFLNGEWTAAYLDNRAFLECTFTDCNLSNANLAHTRLQDTHFSGCKFTGVNFSPADPFLLTMNFENCTLESAVFENMDLSRSTFKGCRMQGATFVNCDLRKLNFDSCDLQGCSFEDCDLREADLSTAINLDIDPEKNRLAKARFSTQNLAGLLKKHDIVVV